MKVSDIGEFGLIRSIHRSAPRPSPGTIIGIGDDAALLRIPPAKLLLATTDALVEGVHFDRAYTDFPSLGWKALAVNLSDIAAMGGVPRFCLVSLSAPATTPVSAINGIYRGMSDLLRLHRMDLAGGNITRSRSMVLSVTVLGIVGKGTAIRRSGARAGDHIYVTGTLGDSSAGLELLKQGMSVRSSTGKELVRRHLRPEPRIAWGAELARKRCASAMIDISDGLLSDLGHICSMSGIGAVIYVERLPISRALQGNRGRLRWPQERYALSGGEDYELLFTVPSKKLALLRSLKFPVTEIGMMTAEAGVVLEGRDGKKRKVRDTGYDHFGRNA